MTKAFMMFCLSSTVALAGTVHFDPPSATITPGAQFVSFDVSVSWETLATIDTMSVMMATLSDSALVFNFAQAFVNSTTIPPALPFSPLWCGALSCVNGVGFGGNRLPPAIGWTSPLLVGTLTVDTSGLLAGEEFKIGVDPEFEADLLGSAASLVASGANQEVLAGMATITVVPEPATLLIFLALGSVAAGRWARGRE